MATSVVFAAGLAALGLAQGPFGLFAGWIVLGIGMGSGLYEAAFAALVRLYGRDSRNSITGITLIAGFASTVGWPLSTVLEARYGWRGACWTWAVLHLAVGLPLNGFLPGVRQPPATADRGAGSPDPRPGNGDEGRAAVLLSLVFAATGFISTAMAAHLPRLLQVTGVSLAGAVLVGALIGPSQVGARLLEFGFLRRMHPLASARWAAAMHPVGVALLALVGAPAAAAFGILHGAGNGILTITKGTLPLVIFGSEGYGHRQGLLMAPARIAQALSPWLFGLALDRWGSGALIVSGTIAVLALLSLFMLRGSARNDALRPPEPAGSSSPMRTPPQ
jgi:predicted MFS family arabinose efflux permease